MAGALPGLGRQWEARHSRERLSWVLHQARGARSKQANISQQNNLSCQHMHEENSTGGYCWHWPAGRGRCSAPLRTPLMEAEMTAATNCGKEGLELSLPSRGKNRCKCPVVRKSLPYPRNKKGTVLPECAVGKPVNMRSCHSCGSVTLHSKRKSWIDFQSIKGD